MTDPAPTGWASFHAAVTARHGAFHLRRCAEHGLPRATVRNRARREGWDHPYPAVFCLPGAAPGWWRTASAGLEAVGPDAALGLRSAAYAHGLVDRAPGTTQIVRRAGRHRPDRAQLQVHPLRTLDEGDIAEVGGLRCTTPHRTLRDLAHGTDVEPLRAMGIEGLRTGVLDLDRLAAEAAGMPPGPAQRRLAEVVTDLTGVATESPFAFEVITALQAAGLPVVGEFPWRCPDGRVIHHDAAVPTAWVAVECDGRAKHRTGDSFTTDRIRWTQASGAWRTVWVDWTRWRREPQAVVLDVVRAVAEADRTRPAAEAAPCRCRRCRRWRAGR